MIVRTLNSGLQSGGSLYFILYVTVTTVKNSQTTITSSSQVRKDIINYMSGDNVIFTLEDVTGDFHFYAIDVIAGNEYGRSGNSSTTELFNSGQQIE